MCNQSIDIIFVILKKLQNAYYNGNITTTKSDNTNIKNSGIKSQKTSVM